jgi:imidazolonepropionase-like amidohydrolase
VLIRIVIAAVILSGCAHTPAATAGLLIRNVNIVTPDRPDIRSGVDVLIEGDRIAAIGRHLRPKPGARALRGDGLYLTPGLIDGHAHLYHATGLNRRFTKSFSELYAAFQEQQPRSYLYYGYTTVVELNADLEANRLFESAPIHPELIHCGQGLVLSNDFMATDFDSEEEFLAAFPNFLHDRFTTPNLPAGFDSADHTPAATVARIADGGGRCVKMYYEEALWWPAQSRPPFALPSENIVREVVAEAHARGMPVLLHGTTPAAYEFADSTGVDVLAHGLWDWEGAHLGREEIPAEALKAVESISRANVSVQPTMQTAANTLSLFTPDLLDDPDLSKVLPASYIEYLRTDGQRGRDAFLERFESLLDEAVASGDAVSSDPEQMVKTYFARMEQITSIMHSRGVPFLFGTDTAVGGSGWGNPPGLNGYWEMRGWARAGVPPKAIFKAATLDNAEIFGLADELGSVEVGKRANLLLMRKNPLETVSAYDTIETVIVGGDPIGRDRLSALRTNDGEE